MLNFLYKKQTWQNTEYDSAKALINCTELSIDN